MDLLKFGWLKNGSAQIWLAQKLVCSNLAGSKMGQLKFGLAQKLVCSNLAGSKMGWLKFGLAQKWVGSNLAAQIRAAQICLAQIRGVITIIISDVPKTHYTTTT